MKQLSDLSAALENGTATSVEMVSKCIDQIKNPAGEGQRVFISTNFEESLKAAQVVDDLRSKGMAPSRFAGIPVSIKDLFDVSGEVTRAGSKVLSNNPPALSDAKVVSRLRSAGMVIMGRTNMTEFAYSGLGINPHYGTPLNPFDRVEKRIPGGSSSGAAVSVTDGMAAIGIGTDTGGSCRIPAAFCGIVGYKPTAQRIPLSGVFPLSTSFDSVGSLGNSVACCSAIDAILSGEEIAGTKIPDPAVITIGILKNYVQEDMDRSVSYAFEKAITQLSIAGIKFRDIILPQLNDLPALNSNGGIIAAEAYTIHKEMLKSGAQEFDPRVSVRIRKALEQYPNEYRDLLKKRQDYISMANNQTQSFDALIMPTTPVIAPKLADMEDDAEYGRLNLLALRNPTVANFLDRCSITLPISAPGSAPVGLMLIGETMSDQKLFGIAELIEQILAD